MFEPVAFPVLERAGMRRVRRLRELEPVLYDREHCLRADPELPVYEIYRDCGDESARASVRRHGLRYDVTVMPPLLVGEEYVKTFGHHHLPLGSVEAHPEVFEVLEGEARFLIQRQRGVEVTGVSLVMAHEGDRVPVPPGRGHVIVNASSRRLVTGNLISQSCVQIYDQYLERRGGAFYVLTSERLVKNPRYPSLPEVQVLNWKTPTFLEGGTGLVDAFLKDPDRFTFLNEPDRCAEWKLSTGALP